MHRTLLALLSCTWCLPALAAAVANPPAAAPRPDSAPALYGRFEGNLGRLERQLLADAADGRLDEHSLLAAVLIAGGQAEPGPIRQAEARLAGWVAELKNPDRLPPQQRAQAALEFLHRRVLHGGYGRDHTDVGQALQSGQFNCVSATVLFCCLAEPLGLAPCGVELPGHVMARVRFGRTPYDVETTCPGWFRLPADSPERAQWLKRAQEGQDAAATTGPSREVGPLELTAMVYYNRGVDLLAAGRFEEALAANAKALHLDPHSTTARGNLLAALNNWAIHLASAGDFAAAAQRLEWGLDLDRSYRAFGVNYAHVHYQWVNALCRDGKIHEAVRTLEHAARVRPEDGYFRKAMLELTPPRP